MSPLKQLQNQLFSVIGQGLDRYGFRSRPKKQDFFKQTTFGKLSFHLAFIEHRLDFDVTADFAIRFDRVEELIRRENKLLSKSEQADTWTIGSELGNFSEGRQKRWTIQTADDVPAIGADIITVFETVAIPYFETYSNEATVLSALSGDGPNSWLHSALHGNRAEIAVAIALLLQGKEAAQLLAKKKLSYLEGRNDFGLLSYREFLDRINI